MNTNWPEDAQRDRLVRDWHFYQRSGGHRTSTDDLLTAWLAVDAAESPVERYCDLGCGIGSVLLQVVHVLRPSESIGVEAQDQSVLMARRSIDELPDPPSIEVIHSDLRKVDARTIGEFDLVTGSPPYLPVGTGVPSPDPQREACRFELRGGIEDYAIKAAELLTPAGYFVVVFQTEWADRVLAAADDAHMHLDRRVDVIPSASRGRPFLSVFAFRHRATTPKIEQLTVRDAAGEWTDEYRRVRALLQLS